jgi:RNA polymerase sigma-70 factor (ECF subfamily)
VQTEAQGWGPEFFDAFRKGEEQAFDRLFRAFYAPLTFFAFKYVRDESVAEDIVQDCFAKLWQRRKKLAKVDAIHSYLYRCVYNLCIDWQQKKKKHSLIAPLPESFDPADIVESETLARIIQVIDHLPQRMKQVVRMHYLENQSLEEIGRVIGIEAETVRSHRYRAIQFIRKTIITG